MIEFHPNCYGCAQQDERGTDFCYDCKYFDSDWTKPSLYSRKLSEAEIERRNVIHRRGFHEEKTKLQREETLRGQSEELLTLLREERAATQKTLDRCLRRRWWHLF